MTVGLALQYRWSRGEIELQRCITESSLLLTASSDVLVTVRLSTRSHSYNKLLNTQYLNPASWSWESKVDDGIWKMVQIIVGWFRADRHRSCNISRWAMSFSNWITEIVGGSDYLA